MDEPRRNTATEVEEARKAVDDTPLMNAFNTSGEYIAAIEAQVERLASRLSIVSDRAEQTTGTDNALPRHGSSIAVTIITEQGHRLANISDSLAKITRELEI